MRSVSLDWVRDTENSAGSDRWRGVFSSYPTGSFISFRLAPKRAASLPLPQHYYLFVVSALQRECEFEECAVERCPVVLGEFDQPGFHDEPAEFDQVTSAFATFHDPAPRINSCLFRFETV